MNKRGQRGAALIVSLVLLVVALLLSLSSMQNSRLEESMAGNYRASDRALMAAEYGAAEVLSGVYGESFDTPTLEGFLNAMSDLIGGYNKIDDDDSVYYTIRSEVAAPDEQSDWNVYLVSVGIVVSGDIENGADYEIVAQREVEFSVRLEGIGKLAAVNPVCVSSFRKTSQSETDGGEDVDVIGNYSPAISARSRAEARRVVAGIIYQKKNPSSSEIDSVDSHSDVKFVPGSSGGEDGVYHASNVVTADGKVDYSRNCPKGNRMCGVKGGVSTSLAAPILNDPDRFHDFISAIMRDPDVNFSTFNSQNFDSGRVNVFTNRLHNVVAGEVSWDSSGNSFPSPIVFSEPQAPAEEGGAQETDVIGANYQDSFYELDGNNVLNASGEILNDDGYRLAKYNAGNGASLSSVEYFPSSQSYYQIVEQGGNIFDADSGSALTDRDYYLQFSGSNLEQASDLWVSSAKKAYDTDGGGENGRGVVRDCLGCANSNDFYVRQHFNDSKSYNGQSGVLIIDGHARFSGNPNFEGLIIVLGEYSISGGGGDDFLGSIISFPYFHDHEKAGFSCEPVNIDHDGSGGHDHIYNQSAVDRAFSLLPEEARLIWLLGSASGNDDEFEFNPHAWLERMSNQESL
ncbi:PilX N-terminal domain-containing pilus assembly protein [Halomonas sp. JS92-SW72]|uniref:PilX N-terminal domain-containing pilus assembly protein n=1 Tax=Halomonas sp. JS92-SW72 TaxID=2306583 RepID=UPI0019691715|nr:PilX N-terminal domain-containing pilus assembly protein [Halomonas sp. JS92-SW72]